MNLKDLSAFSVLDIGLMRFKYAKNLFCRDLNRNKLSTLKTFIRYKNTSTKTIIILQKKIKYILYKNKTFDIILVE